VRRFLAHVVKMATQMYLNIAVKNLDNSIAFFKKLGFSFNSKFTDKNATCLVISKEINVMLLTEMFFKSFIKNKKLINAKKECESIIGIHVGNRKEVDTLFSKSIKAGGKKGNNGYDYGWMYGKTFEDLDGHIWEVFYMDIKKMPKG
jgi:predicted lactoylglutathione lyase